jgi:hypothetical protein
VGADPPDPSQEQPDPSVLAAPTAELDALESGRARSTKDRRSHRPPQVRLGALEDGGLAPAILAIVERGVRRRPALASNLHAEIQLEFEEGHPPVRIVFGERIVLVEDGPGVAPNLRVEGALPDLIRLMVTPLIGGLPNPINARGRAALGMVAGGRVRIEGRIGLMRQLIRVIRV